MSLFALSVTVGRRGVLARALPRSLSAEPPTLKGAWLLVVSPFGQRPRALAVVREVDGFVSEGGGRGSSSRRRRSPSASRARSRGQEREGDQT
jgi:hypothetical protein